MIVNKVTTGFVIQQFDTNKKKFVSQEFIAGDEVDVEDDEGNPLSTYIRDACGIDNHYLPFDMTQPT